MFENKDICLLDRTENANFIRANDSNDMQFRSDANRPQHLLLLQEDMRLMRKDQHCNLRMKTCHCFETPKQTRSPPKHAQFHAPDKKAEN